MKTVLAILGGTLLLAAGGGCGRAGGAAEQGKITVRTELPAAAHFQDGAATQGVIEAVDHAVLSTLIPGQLEKLNVREGDRIQKGQELFQSDRETLENRCTLAEEGLKMAQERLQTREADLELAKVNFEKSKIDYDRSETLYGSNAVSKDSYESAELKYRSGQLSIRQAEASVATAKAEVSFAEATLEIARKHLADSIVEAPYDGIVTAKLRSEYEFCNAGTPVLKIERPGRKRIAAALSAVHYPQFTVGQTRAALSLKGKELCRVPVTILNPAIDPASRTFEVKADLPEDFSLPSGTLCDVAFLFGDRESPSVPEEAVLFRKDGKFAVFVMENGAAKEIPVTPGATQNGRTEILNAEALKGLPVIVSGQYFVNDGSPVAVAGN